MVIGNIAETSGDESDTSLPLRSNNEGSGTLLLADFPAFRVSIREERESTRAESKEADAEQRRLIEEVFKLKVQLAVREARLS